MLNDGPTPAVESLKEMFQRAVAAQNWHNAIEIGNNIKKDAFTFMEQIDLLLQLSQQPPEIASKILYTNAFSHTFVMIGLTLSNPTPLSSCPYFIPAMEVELKNAVIARRLDDATKIRQCGKWCISPQVLEEIDKLEIQLLAAPQQTFLPQQAATNVPAIVSDQAAPVHRPRRFTH